MIVDKYSQWLYLKESKAGNDSNNYHKVSDKLWYVVTIK